ncbi:(deoxy)nucleoside triphosphate pyrophosphohydrolase, partial [Pseudomonadales bacterium]|nr:(deoxy)nucleoside triphosphate pyrophosphohydrolase [Pseudomonadales bacterium]
AKGMAMIEVVAAVIEFGGKLLAFQRGDAKYDYITNKYEFPGGKVEEGEDHKLALARELKEELELDAEISDYVITLEHAYPDFSIKMHCFIVHLNHFDELLKEHKKFAHVSLSHADELDWIEADRPVLQILKERFAHVFTG